jgi:hypothetical protein
MHMFDYELTLALHGIYLWTARLTERSLGDHFHKEDAMFSKLDMASTVVECVEKVQNAIYLQP